MNLIHGDCIEVMASMEPESVDAVVCDPPYGLEFMGKEWDKLGAKVEDQRSKGWHNGSGDWVPGANGPFGGGGNRVVYGKNAVTMQAWHQQWAEAAYRVAKPSAYLLAFGGTRTVHRMTCALEDAGWIIRDMLVWAYASGFPKSKASLKPAWEPIVMARKPGPLRMLAIDACRIGFEDEDDQGRAAKLQELRTKHPGGAPTYGGGKGMPAPNEVGVHPAGRWPANVLLTDPIFDGGIAGVVGGGYQESTAVPGSWAPRGAFPIDNPNPTIYGDSGTYSRFFILPKADRADREPVLGGLSPQPSAIGAHRAGEDEEYEDFIYPAPEGIGRWLRDHRQAAGLSTKAVCEAIGAHGAVNHGGAVSNWEQELNRPTPEQWRRLRASIGFDDRYDETMTATQVVPRQFMQETPPSRRANHHPTVKPVDLMRHLVRLVTPTGGTVLDPFLGSGTTAIAAEMEGFGWVGIEREAEYVAIAEARLNGTQRGLGLPA